MGDFLNQVRTRAVEFYNSLDNRMRWVYGLSSLFVVLGIGFGVFMMNQPHYVVLMRNLTLESAGEITAKLDESQIPWKQDNNNTTVLVPEKQRDKALMELAVGGFTGSGEITWEDVMNKNIITMTNDETNRLVLPAPTTAQTGAVRSLDGVEDAIVNLHVSQDSAFVIEKDDNAKASVILKLKTGNTLKEEQVNGIVMILVNSVKGLKKENVTITDSSGKQLNTNETDTENFQISNRIEMTEAIQDTTKIKLKEFLSTIYGEPNVEVSVNVTLDFDTENSEIITFSPPIEGNEDGLIRSMTDLSETVLNGQTGGAPGTDSNTEAITDYPQINGTDSTYKKANKTLNYELNQIKTNISKAQGQIKTLSIAVIINKTALVGNELTDEQKTEVINLVSAAGGIDSNSILVSAQEFAPKETVTISPEPAGVMGIPIWMVGVIGAALLAGIILTVVIMRRRGRVKEVEEIKQQIEAAELEEIDLDYRDKSSPKYQIEKFIDAKPDAVASLLRSWLNEE